MDRKLVFSPSPHITKRHNTTRGIMLHVLVALAPVVIAAAIIFGYLVVVNVVLCVVFCMGLELLYGLVFLRKRSKGKGENSAAKENKSGVINDETANASDKTKSIVGANAAGINSGNNAGGAIGVNTGGNVGAKKEGLLKKDLKSSTAWDFSSAVTGVILALNLPTYLDIWGLNLKSGGKIVFSFDTVIACFLGSLVAIILVKMLFGGIGKNFANPAAVARIFLFVAFASAFGAVYSGAGTAGGIKGVTGATWLSVRGNVPLLDMVLGKTNAAAVGETCAIAVLAGCIYLCVMRVIDFRVPLVVAGSALVFLLLFDGFLKYKLGFSYNAQVIESPIKNAGDLVEFALRHLLSGGLLFGAVFMCTDYSSTPNTLKGRLVFAAGVGFFTAVLRTWAMPEGISFAILIMNILSPLINKMIKPRFFGMEKEGTKLRGANQRANNANTRIEMDIRQSVNAPDAGSSTLQKEGAKQNLSVVKAKGAKRKKQETCGDEK